MKEAFGEVRINQPGKITIQYYFFDGTFYFDVKPYFDPSEPFPQPVWFKKKEGE